eukprot:m.53193 g.53193  ORF g.53193 m.53193 type:complete len:435 (+) comp11032_c0_seq2:44-1348(+)
MKNQSATRRLDVDSPEFLPFLYERTILGVEQESSGAIELVSIHLLAQNIIYNQRGNEERCIVEGNQLQKLKPLLSGRQTTTAAALPTCANMAIMTRVYDIALGTARTQSGDEEITAIKLETDKEHEWANTLIAEFNEIVAKARKMFEWKLPQEKHFTFFEGEDSPGEEMLIYKGGSIEELSQLCNELLECVAFNTKGELKKIVKEHHHWKPFGDTLVEGLYVVDNFHPCDTGLHHCATHAKCITSTTTPGAYSCECNEKFHGDGRVCLPSLEAGVVRNNALEGFPVTKRETNNHGNIALREVEQDFHFFPATSSDREGDSFMFLSQENEEDTKAYLNRIAAVCMGLLRCIAFTSTGYLKESVLAPSHWKKALPSDGLYIKRGINYCERTSEGCVEEASCQTLDEGLYECKCDDSMKELLVRADEQGDHVEVRSL